MAKTARETLQLIDWLENYDVQRFTEVQRLETSIGMWEYGKWCAKGGKHRLGVMPQIDYRAAPDWETDMDRTGWDAIADISDDEGMRIHEGTLGLDDLSLDILKRVYEEWEPPHVAIENMRIGTTRFYRIRKEALEYIDKKLRNFA